MRSTPVSRARLALLSLALPTASGVGIAAAFAPNHRFGVAPTTTTTATRTRLFASIGGDDADADASGAKTGRAGRAKERALTYGRLVTDRLDTMGAAGFRDVASESASALTEVGEEGDVAAEGGRPLEAGIVGTGLRIAVAVWVVRKIKKMISEDKQLTRDGITAAEDAQLHAWTCNNCGATLYVAKGKEWRYFPKNYKCYLCGNEGRDNFSDTRNQIIERVQDDYEFLSPWEALSKKEQRELLKECGGDEEKAKKVAVERAAPPPTEAPVEVAAEGGEAPAEAAETAEAAEGEGEGAAPTEGSADDGAEAEETKEESTPPPPAPAPSPPPPPPASSKDLDALDMDAF